MPMSIEEISTLSNQYNSIIDIIQNPHGKALAYAMDMNYIDWLNFQIKNFIIRECVLDQYVSVNIDGKMVQLINPDTNHPLLYRDFITDRAGPKFAGYLNVEPGSEYLEGNLKLEEVDDLIQLQKIKTIKYCNDANIVPPDEQLLDNVLSIFKKKHQTQRKLSDFDLTSIETNLLERGILAAVEKLLTQEQINALRVNPNLTASIGKTAWQVGGRINTNIIIHYLNSQEPLKLTYDQTVRNTMIYPGDPNYKKPHETEYNPETAFTHMLIDGVGRVVRTKYLEFYSDLNVTPPQFYLADSSGAPDTFYGLGIPFFEAAIERLDEQGNIILTPNKEEIGDIICDNSSIFGRVFNIKNIYMNAYKELRNLENPGLLEEIITEMRVNASKKKMDQYQLYEEILSTLIDHPRLDPEKRIERQRIFENYQSQKKFIQSSLIAEESGKKEAQSQLFKEEKNIGKLVGNVSDTGAFVHGMLKAYENNDDAKAHLQIVALTTLISVIRWGIDQSNHTHVSDTHEQLTNELFRNSLNLRSYEGESSGGIRKSLKLSQISEAEAQKRLDNYKISFQPVWDTIQKNEAFFKLIDSYKIAKKNLADAQEKEKPEKLLDFNEAQTNLHHSLDTIISVQMPQLSNKLDKFSLDGTRKSIIDSIMDQLEEAIAFGVGRQHMLNQRKAMASQNNSANSPKNALTMQSLFSKTAVKYPSLLRQYVSESKITGPRVYKALQKIRDTSEDDGDKIALKCAQEFLSWCKKQNKHFKTNEIRQFVKELEGKENKENLQIKL